MHPIGSDSENILNPTTSFHFHLCCINCGPEPFHHLLFELFNYLLKGLSYFPLVFLQSNLHPTMGMLFLKGKSGPANTPVSGRCIQNKTQTLTRSRGLPQLTCPFTSLHCSLTQDTLAILSLFLSPEQEILFLAPRPYIFSSFCWKHSSSNLWTASCLFLPVWPLHYDLTQISTYSDKPLPGYPHLQQPLLLMTLFHLLDISYL